MPSALHLELQQFRSWQDSEADIKNCQGKNNTTTAILQRQYYYYNITATTTVLLRQYYYDNQWQWQWTRWKCRHQCTWRKHHQYRIRTKYQLRRYHPLYIRGNHPNGLRPNLTLMVLPLRPEVVPMLFCCVDGDSVGRNDRYW